MSALHQFNLEYNAEQDRLLFRMSTRDGTEIRLWFTRRFVKRLYELLAKLLERDPNVAAQTDPVARKSVVAFQRDSAITQSDFSKEFEEKSTPALPLGEEPVPGDQVQGDANVCWIHARIFPRCRAASERYSKCAVSSLSHSSFVRGVQKNRLGFEPNAGGRGRTDQTPRAIDVRAV